MFSPAIERCVGLVEGAPGAGDALLGVDHHVGDQPGAGERREREQRRGRVAAGVGDDRRVGDPLAVQLGQPVDGLARAAPGAGAGRTSARRSRASAAGSRRSGRRRARRARAAPRRSARRRRAGRRRPPRRSPSRRVEVERLDRERHAVARVELVAGARPSSERPVTADQLEAGMAPQQVRGERAGEARRAGDDHARRAGGARLGAAR